jgi:hypothetical protein
MKTVTVAMQKDGGRSMRESVTAASHPSPQPWHRRSPPRCQPAQLAAPLVAFRDRAGLWIAPLA